MKKKRVISWFMLILWMLVIFFFSAQPGGDSSNLSNSLLMTFEKIFKIPFTSDWCKFLIRKLAHFSEYAILGVLMINVIKQYSINTSRIIFLCILLCFLYACTDEIHQLFVSGRAGRILDVLIDSCGSIFGTIIYYLFLNLKKSNV